jgi:hypothetical protein
MALSTHYFCVTNLCQEILPSVLLLEPINKEFIPHISKSITFGDLKIHFDPLCKDDSTFSECSYIALTILFLILLFSKVADVKKEIVALEINSFLLSNICK